MDRSGLRLASGGRERARRLVAIAVAAAGLVVMIAKVGGAPAWVQLLCVGVGTGLVPLVVDLRGRRAQDDKTAALVREGVASGSEQLRHMGSVGIGDVRGRRAVVDVDNIRRDVELEAPTCLRCFPLPWCQGGGVKVGSGSSEPRHR